MSPYLNAEIVLLAVGECFFWFSYYFANNPLPPLHSELVRYIVLEYMSSLYTFNCAERHINTVHFSGTWANMRKMAHCGNLSVALYVTPPALATRFDQVT